MLISKYMRITMLLPTYKNISSKTYMAMVTLIQNMNTYGFIPAIHFLDQTNVVIARNHLQKAYIDSKDKFQSDIVLWMDSDHPISFQQFMTLLKHFDENNSDLDVLSARYITRDLYQPRVCAYVNTGDFDTPIFNAISIDSTGIQLVDAVGFGMLLMKPEVIDTVYNEHKLHSFIHRPYGLCADGKLVSEDLDWCMKATDLGIRIAVDNEVDIDHEGGIINTNYAKIVRALKGHTFKNVTTN